MILFKVLTKKLEKDGDSQFQNFRVNFHKFHAVFPTRLSQARPSQVLRKMFSENAHGCAQNPENGYGFDFFRPRPQRWRWISQVMKPGFNLWMLKPKSSQSTGCTHIHQTSQKCLNKVYQKADGNCFLWQKRGVDGIHAKLDHNNVRSVLRNTQKRYVGPFGKKGMECWHPV
jgi:hypothetical protein